MQDTKKAMGTNQRIKTVTAYAGFDVVYKK